MIALCATAFGQTPMPDDPSAFIAEMARPIVMVDPQPMSERQLAMRAELAANPGRYAPEIERRLLALLPEQIPDGDALAALGRESVKRAFGRDLENAPPGAGGEIRLRTLISLVELLGREHAEPVLRRFYDKAHALTEQIEPFY
ncbi:MAG: hypothetical protein D6692_14595, partial [Planctomycetota bacterium]